MPPATSPGLSQDGPVAEAKAIVDGSAVRRPSSPRVAGNCGVGVVRRRANPGQQGQVRRSGKAHASRTTSCGTVVAGGFCAPIAGGGPGPVGALAVGARARIGSTPWDEV